MLVLSRKTGERIVILVPGQESITIDTLSAQPGRVRLGFTAAKHIIIHRQEVLDRINQENTKVEVDEFAPKGYV
jgi:carbon storage regulator